MYQAPIKQEILIINQMKQQIIQSTAAANHSEVMEVGDDRLLILTEGKNGRSSKSQMSRGSIFQI